MKLSIIIPLYNSGKYLPTCLDSLLRQNLAKSQFEIIIVNDGSTDDSLEVANAYAEEHSNFKIVSKVNGGVGSARNMGISKASGDYIYFIDPDDYLADHVLSKLIEVAIKENLDILTFGSKSVDINEMLLNSDQRESPELSKIYSGIDYIAKYKFQNEIWWYLIKRSFIEDTQIRFIEDRWMEDAILTVELFTKAERMAKLSLDGHRHVTIIGSAMKSREPEHYLRVIDDNRNAAMVFEPLIRDLENSGANTECIDRLRVRQQSFVFFMMVRMLKSTISLNKVKETMNQLSTTHAYPLTNFISKDYSDFKYKVLTVLFNKKQVYYFLFRIFNPILKRL
ncbi:glycosyltransferase [Winogradskyella tangerina]|uniref:glycosyltransferase n=1 Tax=Winogradskyella tangerina TaxID=2023240 RepID=UPI000DBE0423|nr:glycosyltransferase [Winogradskyella tangerina]